MLTNGQIEAFVTDWMACNIFNQRNPTDRPGDIDRLAAGLTGAARAQGISGSDLHRLLGDIDDYLTAECRQNSSAIPDLQSV